MGDYIIKQLNKVFWNLVVQGVLFVVLGILIWLYPSLLVALATLGLVIIGVSVLVLAARVRTFRNNFIE